MKYRFNALITNTSTTLTYEFDFDESTPCEALEDYLEKIDDAICAGTKAVAFACLHGFETVCALHFMTSPVMEYYDVSFVTQSFIRKLFLSF